MLVIAALIGLNHPILKLIGATLPASKLRSQAALKKIEADSFASQVDAKTAAETKLRDIQLEQLKLQKENCQKRIDQLLPPNAAKTTK